MASFPEKKKTTNHLQCIHDSFSQKKFVAADAHVKFDSMMFFCVVVAAVWAHETKIIQKDFRWISLLVADAWLDQYASDAEGEIIFHN